MKRYRLPAFIAVVLAFSALVDWRAAVLAHPYEEHGIEEQPGEVISPNRGDNGPHYPRERRIDIKHICLDIKLDVPNKRIFATAELTFVALRQDIEWFTLDGIGFDIESITLNGKAVECDYAGKEQLWIETTEPVSSEADSKLAIVYSAMPKSGIHFTGPDEWYPDKPVEVWTQGQPQSNRHWIPCFDAPNEFQTSEIYLTVPKPMTTLSNGELLSIEEVNSSGDSRGDYRRFHWRHDVPHVSYLIMFAAGDFVEIKDGAGGVPVSYFCHRGEERLAYNVVRNTPKMIECFEKTLGVPYPYAKYSQIFLHDFGAGGMENTSATVLARRFLHDDRAHIDFSGEYVVAHELGHQWFGDLLTCRDWGQMWLNEGFATYCECLWAGETGGWEEYQRVIHGKMNQYIDEDRNQHRRPLSTNTYRGYGQVFDAHSYQKGAMVLHMLRRLLGDDTFFRALKHYLETCCGTPVVTADFVKSVEVSTGYNVDRFFDEWVYGAGYPEFTYSWSYDEASGRGTLEVEQTQNDDNDTPKVFGMPVFVTFNRVTDGEISERKWLSARFDDAGKVSESIELDFRPDFMTFDVNNEVLDVTSLANIPEGELGLLLAYEPSGIAACLDAAEELGNRKTPEAQAALLAALDRPRPWMIREAIMNALMQFEKPERVVVAAMIKAVDDADPRVRRAAFRALGECEGNEAAGKTVFEKAQFGDASCLVEAQAFEALGAFQSKDARKLLLEAIDDRDSYHDVIRVACLRSLAKYGNAEDLEMVVALTRPGKDEYLRAGACEALGILGAKLDNAGRGKALDALIDMLEDSGGVVVGGAATGLEGLNDPSVLPLLEARLKTAKGKQAKGVLKSVIAALKRDVGGEDKPSRDKPEPKPADKEEDFVLTPVE